MRGVGLLEPIGASFRHMEGMDVRSGLSGLPPPMMFMGPASAISAMEMLPVHPNVRKLSAHATSIIKNLKRIGALPIGIRITVNDAPVPTPNEAALASLENLRSSVALLNGTRARIFERDLARFVPHLAPKYINAHRDAVARMNEIRATLAFFLGEGDDEGLGYDFVPPPPPASGVSAPSAALDLG